GFYYLLAADTGCGPAAPGTDSRGWFRPPGPRCVEARMVRTLRQGDEASSDPWSLEAHGGPGTEVELSVVLERTTAPGALFAVSFDLVFDPQQMSPAGPPVSGDRFVEAGIPVRVDFDADHAAEGRVTDTVARVGPSGSDEGLEGGVILRTTWKVPGGDSVGPVWLSNVRAMDGNYQELPVPSPRSSYTLEVSALEGDTLP
ncbi:MAG: hypothetical protein ACE5IK_02785, partial [Acidobacteriota bacterium]